ncbi:hypothetical protein ABIB56_003212 [Glaciihabitans sp. UYNi722]
MWCNGLINAGVLSAEITSVDQLKRQRYIDDVSIVSPSVITLNAVAAAAAVNEWLMSVTGLIQGGDQTQWHQADAMTGERLIELPRQDLGCRECGRRRFARGDAIALPTL